MSETHTNERLEAFADGLRAINAIALKKHGVPVYPASSSVPKAAFQLDLYAQGLWADDKYDASKEALLKRAKATYAAATKFFELGGEKAVAWIDCSGWGSPGDHDCGTPADFTARHLVTQCWNDEFAFHVEGPGFEEIVADIRWVLQHFEPEIASQMARHFTYWSEERNDYAYLPGLEDLIRPEHDELKILKEAA